VCHLHPQEPKLLLSQPGEQTQHAQNSPQQTSHVTDLPLLNPREIGGDFAGVNSVFSFVSLDRETNGKDDTLGALQLPNFGVKKRVTFF
jgi:hypothetical protein